MGCVHAADGIGSGFGQAESVNLAGLHQPRHGADGNLDGYGSIYTVLEIHVDRIDTKPLQALVACLDDLVRPTFGAAAKISELGGQEQVHAPFLEHDG